MTGYFKNPYFSEEELRCKGTGKLLIEPEFLKRLIELRERVGVPFQITSACRGPEQNARIGGASGSMHLTENARFKHVDGRVLNTCAVDIRKTSALMRRKELFKWHTANLNLSIGGGRTFYHVDLARELTTEVQRPLFTYKNGSF